MVHAAKTMTLLPTIGAAAHAGSISLDHVHALTYALKHVGFDDTLAVENELLTVATQTSPRDLFTLMRQCKAVAHSDELDEAWLRGMDKSDIRCLPVGDGFHVTGFLPIEVGAKLKAFLDAVSVPRDSEDTRTNAQRRVDGLDQMLTNTLGSGDLPTENSVAPHLSVIVNADTLRETLNGSAADADQQQLLDAEPAILEGFGPIGPALLTYIAFGGNLTPILVAGFNENRTVLDVGRTQRIATKKQRRAIHVRQQGRCANRGCHHPIGEIHHLTDWLYGGKTNLSNLVGLCRKCHALITIGRLQMTGTFETGYTFTTARAGPMARAA
jgi:hypothetical protein